MSDWCRSWLAQCCPEPAEYTGTVQLLRAGIDISGVTMESDHLVEGDVEEPSTDYNALFGENEKRRFTQKTVIGEVSIYCRKGVCFTISKKYCVFAGK